MIMESLTVPQPVEEALSPAVAKATQMLKSELDKEKSVSKKMKIADDVMRTILGEGLDGTSQARAVYAKSTPGQESRTNLAIDGVPLPGGAVGKQKPLLGSGIKEDQDLDPETIVELEVKRADRSVTITKDGEKRMKPKATIAFEKAQIDESRDEALKALEDLVKKGGIDKADFQKAHSLYKANKLNDLRKHISSLDTDPAEAIVRAFSRRDPNAFKSMYPRAKAGDYFANIIGNHKESVEIDELSRDTLASYQKKASDARGHRGLSIAKVDNRYKGVSQASKKLANKESVEIDEMKVKNSDAVMKLEKECLGLEKRISKLTPLARKDDDANMQLVRAKNTLKQKQEKLKQLMKEDVKLDEASNEGTIRIINLGKNKGFQVQSMTNGKFVNVGKPYKDLKSAEEFKHLSYFSQSMSPQARASRAARDLLNKESAGLGEATTAYGKSMDKINNDKKKASISYSDKNKLGQLADMMRKEREKKESVELGEAGSPERLAMIKRAALQVRAKDAASEKKAAAAAKRDMQVKGAQRGMAPLKKDLDETSQKRRPSMQEEQMPTGVQVKHIDKNTGKTHATQLFTASDAMRHEKELKKAGHKIHSRAAVYGTKVGPERLMSK